MTALFIDTNGKIRVNEFPTEPKEPNYGDCEMDASGDPYLSGTELYKTRMEIWTNEMKIYEAALQAALDNGVEVADQDEALTILQKAYRYNRISEFEYTGILSLEDLEESKPYPIPYKMEVKYLIDGPDHRSGGWEEVTEEMYNFVQDGLFGFKKKKLATLSLISNA